MGSSAMFGKYRLVRPLATGGMAQVYIAKQTGLEGFEKVVVLKRILPQHSRNPSFVKMFLDEARISAQLSHPNLVQIFDFGLQDDCYFIAMEYLTGENVNAIIRGAKVRQERVPSEIAATIVSEAANGLHYAHTMTNEQGEPLGIVHRDVTPSNLMVTNQGAVKVLDFGIAKAEGRLAETQTGVIKGKWAYMSPEQVRSETLDGRSDVFALGLVLYELITGVKLFQRDNELAIVAAVMTDPIPPPVTVLPDMPPEMNDIILRALERRKDKRYQTAAELNYALQGFLAHRTHVNSTEALKAYLTNLFGQRRMEELAQVPTTDPGLDFSIDETHTHQFEEKRDGPVSRIVPPRQLAPPPVYGAAAAPYSPSSSSSSTSSTAATTAAPPAFRTAPPRSRRGLVIGALAVALVLAGGAAVALLSGAVGPAKSDTPDEKPGEEIAVPPMAEPADAGSLLAVVPVDPPAPDPVMPKPPVTRQPEVLAKADPLPKPPKTTKRPKPSPAVGTNAGGRDSFGMLQVNCVPWCRIYLDGVDTGRNSPLSDLKLKAGKHRLKVVNPPSGSEREREIEITADDVRREVIRF